MKNGYTSATGTQDILNTPRRRGQGRRRRKAAACTRASCTRTTIEDTLKGMGVQWLRVVHTYEVDAMRRTLEEALTSEFAGPEGDRRRGRMPARAAAPHQALDRRAAAARRAVERVRYGVDEVVQRRPRLHPPVRLPDADDEGQPRSAQGRPGGHGDRRLRRLRPVRRQRPCRHAVPELLPRRGDPEPALARAPAGGPRSRLISLRPA